MLKRNFSKIGLVRYALASGTNEEGAPKLREESDYI